EPADGCGGLGFAGGDQTDCVPVPARAAAGPCDPLQDLLIALFEVGGGHCRCIPERRILTPAPWAAAASHPAQSAAPRPLAGQDGPVGLLPAGRLIAPEEAGRRRGSPWRFPQAAPSAAGQAPDAGEA